MQSTKGQILAFLKRTSGSTVEEVANVLGLARMTVRQHLATLERDDLVQTHEVRRRTGRPHHLYSLTDKAEENFPKRYDRLALMLMREITMLDAQELQGLSPSEKQGLLLSRLADRMAGDYASAVEGKPLPQRVELVTDILQQEGGFAEWRKSAGGYEISDYNCAYRRVAEVNDQLCSWHLRFLSTLLGCEVRGDSLISEGAGHCRFVVNED